MTMKTLGLDVFRIAHRLKSLRSRLFIGLSITIVMFWCLVFGGRLIMNRAENAPWDASLRQLANLIMVSTPTNIVSSTTPQFAGQFDASLAAAEPSDKDAASFQVWLNRQIVVRSQNAPPIPLKPDFANGFADQQIDNENWRVYDASDNEGKIHVQVGKSPRQRDRAILHAGVKWALDTVMLLTLPGLAIWWVIRWSFAPVDAMRKLIENRKPFDLTPLPRYSIPMEVQSLVDAFNRLLEQLHHAVMSERQLIVDAAHELRTPLAALATHAQVGLRAHTLEEKDQALLRMTAVVERSARLSEQMLDAARIDAAAKAPAHSIVDLSGLVIVVMREFEAAAHQRHQLISLETEAAKAIGNVDELGILMRNLFDNALRYSGNGSKISVSCGCRQRDGERRVELAVADNGPGVPDADRRRIFDRFYRVAGNSQRGSGIGLSLVARIAESHHAVIDVGVGLGGGGFGVCVSFPGDAMPPGAIEPQPR